MIPAYRRKRAAAANATLAPGKALAARVRLRQIQTLESANLFLSEHYIAEFNTRSRV